jgi:HAMP domain-containing protein
MTDGPKPAYQRSARNYLLDKQFQLKYTGFLVLIALVMSAALGVLLWRSSSTVVEQSRRTVEQGKAQVKQGEETVERGKEVVDESKKLSEVVSMQIENCYGDSPILKKKFQADADADDQRRAAEQQNFEADAAALQQRATDLQTQEADIERGQRNMFIGLVIALALLVAGIGIAGIVFTHKIAGPIFKMKRLMRQLGEGKLILREKLRKGDELHHFFETFEKMVDQMREAQRSEIKRLDEILEKLGTDKDAGIDALRALRADMVDHIEG